MVQRGDRVMAQIDLGTRTDGMRDRRSKFFDTRDEAEAWLLDVRSRAQELTGGVAEQPLAEYLRWWIEAEAPKGKPGRPPLAATLRGYRSNIERHIDEAVGRHGLGDAQADAVRVLVGSDQRIGLLIGAAGSGKTRALGAAAEAWRLSGREVIGLTVSQAAADVLATEAGVRAENIAKWWLETGHGRWRLSPESLVIVDEASMASTPDLVDLVVQVRDAGARMLLVGDPAQLDAIGIGGAFELLADRHGATELHEVRRFLEPWEHGASLRLCDRADQRPGRDHVGTRPPVAGTCRLVDPGPTVRLHDNVASRGDQIVTRRNDRTLQTNAGGWVVNGDVWTVGPQPTVTAQPQRSGHAMVIGSDCLGRTSRPKHTWPTRPPRTGGRG